MSNDSSFQDVVLGNGMFIILKLNVEVPAFNVNLVMFVDFYSLQLGSAAKTLLSNEGLVTASARPYFADGSMSSSA